MSYNLAEKVGFIKINKNSTRVQKLKISVLSVFRQFPAISESVIGLIGKEHLYTGDRLFLTLATSFLVPKSIQLL